MFSVPSSNGLVGRTRWQFIRLRPVAIDAPASGLCLVGHPAAAMSRAPTMAGYLFEVAAPGIGASNLESLSSVKDIRSSRIVTV